MFIAYIRLNGVNAKEHPIFGELARVKKYFQKIKDLESSSPDRRSLTLSKPAVSRLIKHALVKYNPDEDLFLYEVI